MLLRSTRNPPHLARNTRRYASNASGYSPKVRAIPFALSKEEAIIHLGPHVSMSTAGKGIVGSLGAKFLPGFGFKPIQPTHIQAVYLPSWVVSALFTVDVQPKTMEKETITVCSDDSHMPGFSYKPLSTLSFAEPGRVPLSVPMTSELKRQHGSDVLCWPYTLSPLSLPQVAKSLSNSHITTGDGANWDPASLNFKMLCAYPILRPIYVARYDVGPLSLSCMIQACSHEGLIYIDYGGLADLGQQVREKAPDNFILQQSSRLWTDLGTIAMRGTEHGFSKFMTSTGKSNVEGPMSEFLDSYVEDLDALSKFGVDMDDLRVRECSTDEFEANNRWIHKNLFLQQLKRLSTSFNRFEADVKTVSGPANSHFMKAAKEAIDNSMFKTTLAKDVEEEIRKEKPDWLEEYELSQFGQRDAETKQPFFHILNEIHEAGVIYDDIRDQNLLVDD